MIYLEKKMYSNFLDTVVFMIYPGMFIYVLFYFAEFSILVPISLKRYQHQQVKQIEILLTGDNHLGET